MNYIWKSKWLKQLSNSSKPYKAKLTAIPSRIRPTKISLPDDRRPSEPVLPSSMALRRLSAWSALSRRSNQSVDGVLFKRTVSDLERLLDEALSLALEVADHSEATVRAGYDTLRNDGHFDSSRESDGLSMHSAQENVDMSLVGRDNPPCSARPELKRASTHNCLPKRPRLADIVKSYSGMYEELRKRSRVERAQQPNTSRRTSQSLSPQRAIQEDNTDFKGKPVTLEDLLKFGTSEQGLQQNLVRKCSAAANSSSALRNTARQEILPDHETVGRSLHGEHGISLRKRSHVSLRNMKGFNLPKSHPRQPIARD
ncbi:hypothetical protein F66182_516 [Fusarium sp. NRRL 66182]|nr:hypothetical protein F66182_516 [Fusarium sp. NRRL 66182]